MRNFLFLSVLAFSAVILLSGCVSSPNYEMAKDFRVHQVFGDNMVLQRNAPIRLSGYAEPGKAVKLTIGSEEGYAQADANGKWQSALPALEAGGPYTITITGVEGSQAISFANVLIGEVWLASGQSNMQMPVWSGRAFWNTMNGEEEVKNADYPNIRLYQTSNVLSPGVVKAEIAGSGWLACSPSTVGRFSAAGYFFARQLYKDLKVPVGIINSSWGGTPVQSWISLDGYRMGNRESEIISIEAASNPNAELNQKQKELEAREKTLFAEWEKRFYNSDPVATEAAKAWKNPDFKVSDWETVKVPYRLASDLDGAVWFRYTVDIPAAWSGRELVLSLGAIDDCDETYFEGEKVGATGSDIPNHWSVNRNYRIPARLVKTGASVIAVRVIDMYLDGGMMGPAERLYLHPVNEAANKISLAGEWKTKLEFRADAKKIGNRPNPPGNINTGVKSPNFPATLYNAMIAPWTEYTIRGAIWYQGESNAGAYQDYMTLFPLLIQDWRARWNNPELAFIFVQLAAFEKHQPKEPQAADFWEKRQPVDSAWPKLREVQTATLNLPYTGMAVTIDIGDAFDIHPADKQTVGFRLAKEAERIVYGNKEVTAGPLYKSMKIENGRIRLTFDNVGGGLVAKGGFPTSFAIAGKDGNFVWAKAEIDGKTIVVRADSVKEPVAVRYAWASWPGNANLYNKEGFPASPFRTDMPDYLLKKK